MRWFKRGMSGQSEIWRGVYSRFADVPRSGSAFAGEVWKNELVAQLQSMKGQWSDDVVIEHEALMLVLESLSSSPGDRHVVDFGGGFGATYFYIHRKAPEIRIRYDVVELPEVVSAARELVPAGTVAFSEGLASEHRGADVLFVKSVLQYVHDYHALAISLFGLHARFVLFEKFSGVECDSYASAQVNVPGSSIPYWFISIRELLDLADAEGYDCVLRRRLMRPYDQSAFPEHLRMGQASTLIFRRR